jgi:heme exporter protein C
MITLLYPYASLKRFYQLAGKLLPFTGLACALLLAYGFWGGLVLAPPDYQQGDGFRIIYVHVPSAFLSLMVYMVMASAAIAASVWKLKLADLVTRAAAPIGASFTLLALITGSLWGKPMWGTYWIWDARLTSEFILLLLYLGFMSLQTAIPNPEIAMKAGRILAMVGAINIPIIHYSVYWWNTLHQGATLSKLAKPSIAPSMLHPLLFMIAGFIFFFITALLLRVRNEILQREANSQWVKSLIA